MCFIMSSNYLPRLIVDFILTCEKYDMYKESKYIKDCIHNFDITNNKNSFYNKKTKSFVYNNIILARRKGDKDYTKSEKQSLHISNK